MCQEKLGTETDTWDIKVTTNKSSWKPHFLGRDKPLKKEFIGWVKF